MNYSWASIGFCFLVVIFSKPLLVEYETVAHEVMDFSGYFLVAICALGRVYASAFLGGFKNKALITYGPFSVVRNPLYCFSLIGVCGLSLISGHVIIVFCLTGFFVLMYRQLILREEKFLLAEFGDSYKDYMSRVPRLLPRFSLYNCPDEIALRPRFITKACFDSIWWFATFPAFELIEYLQESGIVPTLGG